MWARRVQLCVPPPRQEITSGVAVVDERAENIHGGPRLSDGDGYRDRRVDMLHVSAPAFGDCGYDLLNGRLQKKYIRRAALLRTSINLL